MIRTSCPGHRDGDEEVEDDSDVEDVVEENEDLIETIYTNGNNEMVEMFSQKCDICSEREIVIMHLNNVVINVFVSNVIEMKVILIYENVLFVEHNKKLTFFCIITPNLQVNLF